MKPSLLLWIALITIVATSIFWFSFFHSLPMSIKTDDWSNFGSYIGGVAGPVLSFISILLVIETIKQTQKNHKEQVRLIIQEQTYSKFQDLCTYLESTLEKSWLNTKGRLFSDVIKNIKTEVIFHSDQNENISLAYKYAITLEVTSRYLENKPFLEINDVAVIIRTINKFIFSHDSDDKQLMLNMIELKITKEQRLLIYMIMRRDYPKEAESIHSHWHTFSSYPWGV